MIALAIFLAVAIVFNAAIATQGTVYVVKDHGWEGGWYIVAYLWMLVLAQIGLAAIHWEAMA